MRRTIWDGETLRTSASRTTVLIVGFWNAPLQQADVGAVETAFKAQLLLGELPILADLP